MEWKVESTGTPAKLLMSPVSWIRTKDLHILTSGPVKFTADDRFDWKHQPDSSDWSLRLTKSQVTDSGIYECQVNTDPKMNRKITLDIGFVPLRNSLYEDSDSSMTMVDDEGESPVRGETVTKILGKEEQFVKIGSTITFTCVIIIPGEPVSQVDWLKNGRQVSFQASRGGIIVSTEKSEGRATSRLILADVKPQDSGNYTCKPGNSKSHSIALVVIEGERTEAMQRHKNGGALRRIPVTQVCLIGALYLVYNSVVF
ncbi:hypothetical protein RUM43_000106 [Polyplax serrata]|uniref:Ig-like domain-containing protein n=1 Tax=Polyplax serrata TaxID=468196 RepID=A0AAN8SBU0_POLSC